MNLSRRQIWIWWKQNRCFYYHFQQLWVPSLHLPCWCEKNHCCLVLGYLRQHFPIRQNGGNAYASRFHHNKLNASTVIAWGSGFQLTYLSLWVFSRSATWSTAQVPSMFSIWCTTWGFSCQLLLSAKTLDWWSSSTFCTPGRYFAVIMILWDRQYWLISCVIFNRLYCWFELM